MEQKFEQAISAIKGNVEKTQSDMKAQMEKMLKTTQELMTFGQGNLEAFVKSGQIWSAGVQDLSKNLASTAQAQLTEAVATAKTFAAVKSINELVDLQAAYLRGSIEKAVAETTKLADASKKLTTEAMAPIAARLTLANETFSRAI
jgi:phasin family protein